MPVELALVESRTQLRQAITAFNIEAKVHRDRTQKILSQTTYWVWDADSEVFGPSKFVGFRGLDFDGYEAATQGQSAGVRFDGNLTQRAIRKVAAPFRRNDQLAAKLRNWAAELAGPNVFDDVDDGKWLFVTLGPEVQPPTMEFEIGKIYNRQRDIHSRFGGQAQGGISTPAGAQSIFLFTGASGEQYGYRDGWGKDGVFLYTGEGQIGDMKFHAGNKAIRDHVPNGKDLLLFQSVAKGQGYRFLGHFVSTSWEIREGPDLKGNLRDVHRVSSCSAGGRRFL